MNLCDQLEEQCAHADTSLVDNICTEMFNFTRDKSLIRARVGLCTFSGKLETDSIDKLMQFDYETRQDLCRLINHKLQESMNLNGTSFEVFHCQIQLVKKTTNTEKITKRPHGVVFLKWRKLLSKKRRIQESNIQLKCAVCLETKSAVSSSCGHIYCTDCAPKLHGKPCPICRTFCSHMHPIFAA